MSKPKFSNRDYGYQPNMADDLMDMEYIVPTDGVRMAGAIEKHSEFMRPNEDAYNDMEYSYPRPPKTRPYSIITPPWPGNNWPPTKADCEGLWNRIFPDHRSKTGDFIPTRQDHERLKRYADSGCPMEYVHTWCCKKAKIMGPKKVEVNSVTDYSVSNTNPHCDYTWSASAGRIPGGTFYAPSSEQVVDISISPLGTIDTGQACDTIKVQVKSSAGCIAESIGISGTTQMNVGESKTLTVLNSRPGVTYTWVVSTGGGSISPATGTSTTYTAPASNPNCTNNPTIQLKIGTNICDSVRLAVNGSSSTNWVVWTYTDFSCYQPGTNCIINCSIQVNAYGCDGLLKYGPCGYSKQCAGSLCNGDGCPGSQFPSCDTCKNSPVDIPACYLGSGYSLAYWLAKNPEDRRSSSEKASGCCPYQLL